MKPVLDNAATEINSGGALVIKRVQSQSDSRVVMIRADVLHPLARLAL